PHSPVGEDLNQTLKSCGHSVLIAMVGYACKGDGKKDKNKADHNIFPNFSFQGHSGEFSGRFLEGLNSAQP
ncbi:MAG: hypothetical protein ACM3N7_00335, partial [Planctomycetaceae bacterium]